MSDTLPFLLGFLAVDAVALLVILIVVLKRKHQRNRIRHFGDLAEEAVAQYIREHIPGAILLNNLFLKYKSGITQIDHVLLCKWGVFVIETKSHNGKINIGEREWIQIYGEKVIRFHSPLLQNEIHCRALSAALSRCPAARRVPVRGLVVFTSRKMHFSHRKEGVIRLEELEHTVKTGSPRRNRRGAVTADLRRRYLPAKKLRELEEHLLGLAVKSYRGKQKHELWVKKRDRNR